MNSATSFSKNSAVSKIIPPALLVLSILGFLDAAYLTAEHYLDAVPPCPILGECERVLTSQYATIGAVPISLLGAIYYLTIIVLTVLYLDTRNRTSLRIAAYLTGAGFATSLGLVYLQLFVIHALCLYCLVSATTSTVLFALGLLTLKTLKSTP